MTRTRALMRAGALVAATALAITACGSSGGSKSSGGGGSDASSGSGISTSTLRPSTAKGGTLNMGYTDDFDSLDPARQYYATAWNFSNAYYARTLLSFSPAVGAPKLVPDMATDMGTTSADGLTYTYKIKSGIKFADGATVTTKDIKYAIERVFATDVINGGPTYLICLLSKCDATGASTEYQGPYKDTKGLSSIDTPDDSTIVFHLQKKYADFPYLLQIPDTSPVQQSADTRDKYAQKPGSTGPYQVQSYSPGKSLVLVRNPNWDASTDSLRKALPDRINVVEGLDATDLDSRILAGTLDIDVDQVGVQVPAQAKILRDQNLKANQSINTVTGFLRYISIQTKVAPFDNVHCRRAVQYALDKKSMQTARGGPVTGGEIATTLFPPTLAGYHKFDLYPSGSDNTGDLTKAKDELKQCGKPAGFSTVMAYSIKGKGPKDATAVQQSLARVGIKVSLDGRNPSTYYSNDIGTPSNVKAKGYGLADAGWGPDWPAPLGYVTSIVDGRQIKQSGNSNYSELNDPRVNAAIDAAAAAATPAAGAAVASKVDDYVMEDANIVPFVYDRTLEAYSARLKNVFFTQAYSMTSYMNLGVN